MTSTTSRSGRRAGRASNQLVHQTAPWIEGLGRGGHVAIGLIICGAFMMVKRGMVASWSDSNQGAGSTDSHLVLWTNRAQTSPHHPVLVRSTGAT
jgi:hypothetical protein